MPKGRKAYSSERNIDGRRKNSYMSYKLKFSATIAIRKYGYVDCINCGSRFTTADNLIGHAFYCRNQLYTCNICNKTFTDKNVMLRHLDLCN